MVAKQAVCASVIIILLMQTPLFQSNEQSKQIPILNSKILLRETVKVYPYTVLLLKNSPLSKQDEEIQQYSNMIQAYSTMHSIKFYISSADLIELDFKLFPGYKPEEKFSLFLYDFEGKIYKYQGLEFKVKDMIKFCNDVLDKNSATLARGKQRKCVIPSIDQVSYDQYYFNQEVFILIYKPELLIDFSKPEISCYINDAIKKLNLKYELYLLLNDELGSQIKEKYDIIDQDIPQVFIIDSAKISKKYAKIEYPHTALFIHLFYF